MRRFLQSKKERKVTKQAWNYDKRVGKGKRHTGESGDTAGNSELRRRKTGGTVGERGRRQPEAGAFETGDSRHAGIGIQRRKML